MQQWLTSPSGRFATCQPLLVRWEKLREQWHGRWWAPCSFLRWRRRLHAEVPGPQRLLTRLCPQPPRARRMPTTPFRSPARRAGRWMTLTLGDRWARAGSVRLFVWGGVVGVGVGRCFPTGCPCDALAVLQPPSCHTQSPYARAGHVLVHSPLPHSRQAQWCSGTVVGNKRHQSLFPVAPGVPAPPTYAGSVYLAREREHKYIVALKVRQTVITHGHGAGGRGQGAWGHGGSVCVGGGGH